MSDPSLAFSPFHLEFRFHPVSPVVQGMERQTFLHPALHPELVPWLHEELHIPQDREILLFEQWCPLARDGYFFDLVGTYAHADDPQDAPRFWLHSPPAGDRPGYTARDEHMYDPHTTPLIAWRRRIVYQHAPPWLEARWHPVTGVRLDVCGVDALAPSTLSEFCTKSRRLLQQASRRGRPPGRAYFANADALQARVISIMQQAIREGRSPTQEQVALYFGIKTSDRQLRTWLSHFGLRWQDLLHRVRSGEISS